MADSGTRLFDEVLADARTKAERTRKRGTREAEAAARRIDEQIAAEVEQIISQGRKQAEARRGEIMATVEIEAQRERLAMLEEKLDAVRAAADRLLRDVSPEERKAGVKQLARQALDMLPPGEYELALPAEFHGEMARQLADQLSIVAAVEADEKRKKTVRPAADPAPGNGPVLRSADGSTVVNQDPAERLRRLWPELRLMAARKLFGR